MIYGKAVIYRLIEVTHELLVISQIGSSNKGPEQLLAAAAILVGLSIYSNSFSLHKRYRDLVEELRKIRFESISVAVNSAAKLAY